MAPLDELSDLELSEALRGFTAKQKDKWLWNSTDVQTYMKERELIDLVRQQPALYNRRHWQFDDQPHKERVWQSIADKLKLRLCQCLNSWAELRYRYQQHVRRLRTFRRKVQQGQRQLKRPTMLYEEDLLFLFPHVARHPVLREEEEVPEDNDDVAILPPPPAAIIDVDADYAEEQLQQFKLSGEEERLIEALQPYPQLYDSQHPNYDNYRHRGLIWVAISNELQEQATKLMKIWLQLQTRYEWQLMHGGGTHCPALKFLAPHVRQKEQTVCKVSLYLQHAWHDPIENFRAVMQLLNVFKTLPELAQLVEDYVDSEQKPSHYAELWQRVAMHMDVSAERCEVTWLMLRSFYLELHEMRKAGYQLQDKWFFEKIISGFYKMLAARTKGRTRKRLRLSSDSSSSTTTTPPPAKRAAVEISSMTTSTSECCSSKYSGWCSSEAGSSSSNSPIVLSRASSTASRSDEDNKPSTSSRARESRSISGPSLINTSSAIRGCTSSGNSTASSYVSAIPHSNSGAVVTELPSLALPKLLPAPMEAYSTCTLSRLSKPLILKPMTNIARALQQDPKAQGSARVGAGAGVETGVGVEGEAAGADGRVTEEGAKAEVRVGARPGAVDNVEKRGVVPEVEAVIGTGGSAEEGTGVGELVGAGGRAVLNGMLPMLKPAPAEAAASSKPKITPAVPQLLPLLKLLPMPQLMPKPPPDIKVEFLKDAATGRQLRISGGTLQQPSMLEMSDVILFVREVLAIPQLHSKEATLQAKIEELWQQISKNYNLPGELQEDIEYPKYISISLVSI